MVIGGCCSSACSTALGTVDVMGYGLLATAGEERGGSDEGPVQAGAAVLQIRVGLAGGGDEGGVDVGEDEVLGAARAGAGDAVGAGERGEADELELPFLTDPVDVRDVHLVLEGPHRDHRLGDELE